MVDWLVPLADLNFDGSEKEAVNAVLDSGWLAMGAGVQAFEEEFARLVGVKHAVAVTNGTVSLHLAALALGLGPGDEVIVPSLTFVATAAAILYVGATPVFADINGEQDLTISLDSIEERITDRTKAIFVMHYGGYPCDMPAVMDLAAKYGLGVVEDAAHAPGASIDGRGMGGWGHIGSFSFFPNKNLTTAEGGMVTTNDDELAERIRLGREYGNDGHYDTVFAGLNARMSEFNALLGLKSLGMLEAAAASRNETAARFEEWLGRLPGVSFQKVRPGDRCSYKDFSIVIDPEKFGMNRDELALALAAEGVDTRKYYYPAVHHQSAYAAYYQGQPLPATDLLETHSLSLPIWSHMPVEVTEGICRAIERIHLNARAVREQLGAGQRA